MRIGNNWLINAGQLNSKLSQRDAKLSWKSFLVLPTFCDDKMDDNNVNNSILLSQNGRQQCQS